MFTLLWRPLVLLVCLVSASVAQIDVCFSDPGTQNVPLTNTFNFSNVDQFGMNLFRELVPSGASPSTANLLVSPYSVWSALSLAHMGAEGSTRQQLEQALGLSGTKIESFRKKVAIDYLLNLVGSGGSGRPDLRRVDRAYFDKSLPLRSCVSKVISNVEIIDFSKTDSATAKINQDVSRGTGGEINNFLNSNALANAVFVLINAIYFKGSWQHMFDGKDTRRQGFFNTDGTRLTDADMMSQQGFFNIVRSPALGASILDLPYDKSNMSMLVMLPDIEKPLVEDVLKTLSPYTLAEALKASQRLPVKVFMPKFDLKTELQDELVHALQRLGITDMFSPSKANLTDFSTSSPPLFADTVIHQAKVKVDEKGTVASAATAIVGTRSGPGQFLPFTVDRPFVFLIYEKRIRVTLFAGVVRNPNI